MKMIPFQKGLGAQRVKANFNEIESQAAQRDKDKETLASMAAQHDTRSKDDEEKKM
jgi:ATP-dependent protease ClpP protease subunit